MIEIPGGLHDSTRRPKRLRVVSSGDWYLAGEGTLVKAGFGELGLADLEAVRRDLGRRVFVAHPKVRPLENYLGRSGPRLNRRLRWYERMSSPPMPTVGAVARGAQVAVLPGRGVVWVDGEGLFKPGAPVPLPWTDPPVELVVVRPRDLIAELKLVIGPGGPRRVQPPPDS